VGTLALTAGLAAACFVKAFGISFLAIPRSQEAEQAHEVSLSMKCAMLFLAALCVLLGLLPFYAVPFLAQTMVGLPGFDAAGLTFHPGLQMNVPGISSRISPAYVALFLLITIAVLPIAFRIFRVNRKLRLGDSWGCGRVGQTPLMEYTGTAFAQPLRKVFKALYRPTKDVTLDVHPESKYFVQSIHYQSQVRTWFEEFLYSPLVRWVQQIGSSGRLIQSGSVNLYVGYILVALLAFLLLARWL
jgi:hydrogenase-4 component B